jgi:hypothetical protein
VGYDGEAGRPLAEDTLFVRDGRVKLLPPAVLNLVPIVWRDMSPWAGDAIA